jgi:hypothetical protein
MREKPEVPDSLDDSISSVELEMNLPAESLSNGEAEKISRDDITFVVPIYKLKGNRLKNLMFILPHIAVTGCKIIIAEQIDDPQENKSVIPGLIKSLKTVQYVAWPKKFDNDVEKHFHRTALINYITQFYVKTEWVWVNNADAYLKWHELLFWLDPVYDFILPYKQCKRINEDTTKSIIKGEKVDIDFLDPLGAFECCYGDHSFLYRKDVFLTNGGFDENFLGSRYEGLDLYRMLILKNVPIQKIHAQAIHMFHDVDEDVYNKTRAIHAVKLEAKFGRQGQSLETMEVNFLKNWRKKKPIMRHRNDMAVITSHFNWSGFKRPAANLNRFLRYMESKQIPVYGVEVSLTGNFTTEGNENWLHIKGNEHNILFQKECLLNLAEKMVPDKYTKIAWFDHDVFLDNDTWYDETSFALDRNQIVQVFENAYWTTEVGTIAKEVPAMCKYPPKEGTWTGHPGFGIAANRTMWDPEIGGLYPYCPLGHGDTVFLYDAFECPLNEHTKIGVGLPNCPDFAPYHKWRNNIIDFAAGKPIGSGEGKGSSKLISYVEGNCFHEWHGDIFNRSYVDRAFLMTWYNPANQIFINEKGILELQNVPDTWLKMIQKYFFDRREDGTILEGMPQ